MRRFPLAGIGHLEDGTPYCLAKDCGFVAKQKEDGTWNYGCCGKHPDMHHLNHEGAGHGIETGAGLVIVDIDMKHGIDGYASIAGRVIPDTHVVKTPTNGGHLYFWYDPNVHNVARRIGVLPGVDILGDGGMVVSAGSPHANGGVYEVANDVPIAPAPEWVLELGKKIEVLPAEVPVAITPDSPKYQENLERCIRELLTVEPAVEGNRDNRFFQVAQIPVRKYQLPLDVAEHLLIEVFNPRCEPPWSPEECRAVARKVQQAAEHGQATIGTHDWIQSLVHTALHPVKDPTAPHEYTFDVGMPASTKSSKITPANVLNILLYHDDWREVWRFDDFRKKLRAFSPPMRLEAESIGFTESDAVKVANWFEIHGYLTTKTCVQEQVEVAAKKQAFHPVHDYLNSLPQPTTSYLPRLAETIYKDPSDWAQRFLTNALVGACRRILNPGCDHDYVLVLQGGQGAGKSKSIQALFGKEFTGQQFPDLGDMVRACMDIQGKWVLEAGELDKILKAGQNAVKDFISRSVDSFTPKYGRFQVDLPRQCLFIGTTNDDDWLRDKTGNRRYQPVIVPKDLEIDRGWIHDHRDEIWSEAFALAKTDFKAYMRRDEDAQIDELIRSTFEQKDAWFEKVRECCVGRKHVRAQDVYFAICTDAQAIERYDNLKQARITGILKQLGCERKNTKVGKQVVSAWWVPEDLQTAQLTPEEATKRALLETAHRAARN